MENPQAKDNCAILRTINPMILILGLFSFSLGLALASYLNIQVHWGGILAGFGFWLSSQLLEGAVQWALTIKHDQLKQGSQNLLLVAMAVISFLLMLMAFLLVIIIRQTNSNAAVLVFLSIVLLLTLARSLSFSNDKIRPYREIFDAIILAGLLPAFSFLIVTGEFHRLLALLFIPLVFIFFGAMIALAFPSYASDLAQNRNSFLIKIGWQKATVLHDISLLGGLIILGISGLAGLPWKLLWPNLLLLLPIILEIVVIRRMVGGAKKNWRLLRLNAISILFLSTYILIFSLLIN